MESCNYTEFWNEVLKQIKEDFVSQNKENDYILWFPQISYYEAKQNKIIISVPSMFYRDQLKTRGYIDIIKNKFFDLFGINIELEIIIKINSKPSQTTTDSYDKEYFTEQQISTKNTISTSNNDIDNSNEKLKKHPQLRSDFTFDTYVKCENNTFAYNAGLAISKNPGKAYNPVLIYGGVGVGKTHLMQAIGNEIYKNFNNKVIYITAENFTNEFISSVHSDTRTTNSMSKFKNKYRNADVLLIDDIQFLQKKDGTQEELFNTFDALVNANKQIVFTCDRPVSELKNLTDRLRSRFQMGLNTDILTPNFEGRRAILQKKVEEENLINKIPSEVLDLIAQNVETNVRDLVACLTKIVAYTELVEEKVTIEIAQNLLRDMFFSPRTENINIENIIKVVADYYNVSFIDLKGQKRNKNIMLPRQIAMYICRKLTEYSTTEIGREFGGRDHTTVMHSCEKIEQDILSDTTLDSTIQLLIRKIKDYKK